MSKITNPPIYQKLVLPRDFRLLRVSQDPQTQEISIDLSTFSIDNKPEYLAVSYVWGLEEANNTVKCSGTDIGIRPNLNSLLKQLVSEGRQEWFYIDRLCINQDDLAERTQQVLLMGKIYNNAKHVIIWLGELNETYELAFDTITCLGSDIEVWESQNHESGRVQQAFSWPAYVAPGLPGIAAVQEFLKADWFHRVWTFQELVMCKSANFRCGERLLPWRFLAKLLVHYKKYRPGLRAEDGFLRRTEAAAFEMYKSQTSFRRPGQYDEALGVALTSFAALLNALRQHRASDARDKVFALLNVANDVSSSEILPDYEKSPLDVYAEAMKWILHKYQNLSFLSMVEVQEGPGLVSWVPDFRKVDQWNFLHQP